MILVFRQGCTPEEIAHAEARLKTIGLIPHTLCGVERTVIAAIGDERKTSAEELSMIPGVENVFPILAPYQLASREMQKETSIFSIGGKDSPAGGVSNRVEFGGARIPFIAGPCAVEGRSQVIEVAHAVKEAGATALRAGAFKPRTSPYQFQGLAEEGLEYLAEARDATGLPIVTEVLTPNDVPLVAKYADVLQVGTRNMQNFLLLRACGAIAHRCCSSAACPRRLKNICSLPNTFSAGGNPRVMLCERGIRTFETYVRNTFALAMVPALKEKSHLPVLADPSHGTGVRKFVPPMTKAADRLRRRRHPDRSPSRPRKSADRRRANDQRQRFCQAD